MDSGLLFVLVNGIYIILLSKGALYFISEYSHHTNPACFTGLRAPAGASGVTP